MAGTTDNHVEVGPTAEAGGTTEPAGDQERLAAHMAALGQITPAVAHDLRGPINAMVFNLEILKETVASGRGDQPGGRERLLRYVEVLREELAKLHRGMEAFLGLTTGRGDRTELLDLRETVGELALVLTGPARKQQVQVASELPDHPVVVEGNRYLLRQALLQVGLAALAGAARGQKLQVALLGGDGRARLWVGASGQAAAPEEKPAGEEAARLGLAAPLLAQQGGRLQTGELPGGERGYEVEWRVRPT